MSTKLRFDKGSRHSEVTFMQRIIVLLSRTPEFRGLEKNINRIVPHKEQKDLQDLMLYFRIGLHGSALSVEIQQRSLREFKQYRQIVIDYVSAYKPGIRFSKLNDFKRAITNKQIKILKKGKLANSGARLLVFYTYEASTDRIDHIFLYDIKELSQHIALIEKSGDFRTNIKSSGENWGSAFIAVYPELIESCRIKSLTELMKLAFPNLIKT